VDLHQIVAAAIQAVDLLIDQARVRRDPLHRSRVQVPADTRIEGRTR
jgi:hypothetical protein